MWSWHIWVTDHNMNNTIEVHNNPSVGGSVISNFMYEDYSEILRESIRLESFNNDYSSIKQYSATNLPF